MNPNNKRVSFSTAAAQMNQRGDLIRAWARSSDNPLLKKLAVECIEVFERGGKQ